jgi:MFS family permease
MLPFLQRLLILSSVAFGTIQCFSTTTNQNFYLKEHQPRSTRNLLTKHFGGNNYNIVEVVSNVKDIPLKILSRDTTAIEEKATNVVVVVDNDDDNPRLLIIMMTLIFMVGSLSSLDRVAMSVALVPMSEEMAISDTVKGSISSFFSLGYGLGILPAGLLLSKLSPRTIMAFGVCFFCMGTIFTPFAAAQSDMSLLLGARMLVGASESVVIPTIQRLLSNWVPPEKKSLAVAIVFCGFQFGTIMAYSISPSLIDQFEDWRCIFYIYGAAGLLFLIPWLILARDTPDPTTLEPTSVKDITTGKSLSLFEDAKNILYSAPWKEFSTSKATWAMFLVSCFYCCAVCVKHPSICRRYSYQFWLFVIAGSCG